MRDRAPLNQEPSSHFHAPRFTALRGEDRTPPGEIPHHVLEHHTVGHLWLGILPRFARRKDPNFGVLVLGET